MVALKILVKISRGRWLVPSRIMYQSWALLWGQAKRGTTVCSLCCLRICTVYVALFCINIIHEKQFALWYIHSVTLVLKLGYINLPWGSQYLAWKTLCSILNDYLQKTTPIYFPCQLFWQRKRMRKVYGVCDLIATKICVVKYCYDILRMWV